MDVSDWVRKLWRGDVKLVFTYWIVAACGNYSFRLVDIFFDKFGYYEAIAEGEWTGGEIFLWIFLASAIPSLYFLFSAVCVWRSANKYKGRAVWAVLAKAAMVIGLIWMIKDFVDFMILDYADYIGTA